MPNRLAGETSPYLLQHKDNPVDWFAWGEEALSRARDEGKPLLVSVGYSACHWCHVMERESFEDAEIAGLMNERFVCIKVDREERPDVDAICMEACQAMTGHGGWPLNTFMTPEQAPFYAGTYFPPEPRHGLPSWRMVLLAVADAWENRADDVRAQGSQLVQTLGASARLEPSAEPIRAELLDRAAASLRASYDAANGGFGGAPKFPPSSAIEFLLARGEREMSLGTLAAMAAGGIYDQVGGGFARYAVDATWTVPHFEKMLYDNALLARAYLHGWQVSGTDRFREVCCETLDWALREMRGPEGGFCAALDADSEGVEGKFYVWSDDELRETLGELYEAAVAYFAPRPFEPGLVVLEARGPRPAELAQIRERLLAARSDRVRPGLDDKRLTSWNALMISALAEAGAAMQRTDYLAAAVGCASFLLGERRDADGRLLRTPQIGGFLDDHAFLLEALITLYETTFDPRWYREAVSLADALIARFSDSERGGFFTTARRPRAAARAAQGPRGLADPLRELIGRVRAAAAGAALRRGQVRAPRARRAATDVRDRPPPSARLRPPAPGARLLSLPGTRGGDRRTVGRGAGARRARLLPATPRACRGPGRRRPAARGPRSGRRPRGRLRVRALHLQGACDDAGGAGRGSVTPGGAHARPRLARMRARGRAACGPASQRTGR